jgi:hypothetical protein
MKIFINTLLAAAFFVSVPSWAGSAAPLPSLPKSVVLPDAIANAKVPMTKQESQVSTLATLGGGAWTSTVFGPTVYQRGSYYSTPVMNPIGPVTNANITTSVYYTWQTSYFPTNLVVYLCNYARCVSLSPFSQRGNTNAFSGDIANSQFIFYFAVAGSGLLSPPMYGGNNQIIVNYQ